MSDEQLVNRANYFGGSDAAAVMGKNRFRTPKEVYRKIRPDVPYESEDLSENRDVMRGEHCESLALEELCRTYPSLGCEEVWDRFDDGGGHEDQIFLRHPDKPYIGGHPDGISISPFADEVVLHEIKAPKSSSIKRIEKNGLYDRYKWQVYHYAGIIAAQTDLDVSIKVHLWSCDDWDVISYGLDYRPDLFEVLVERYDRMWAFAQEEVSYGDTDLDFKADYEPDVYSSDRANELLKLYHKVHQTYKSCKEQRKELKSKILSLIDGEERIEGENHYAKIGYRSNSTHLKVRKKS